MYERPALGSIRATCNETLTSPGLACSDTACAADHSLTEAREGLLSTFCLESAIASSLIAGCWQTSWLGGRPAGSVLLARLVLQVFGESVNAVRGCWKVCGGRQICRNAMAGPFPALLNGVSIFIQQNMSRDRGGVGQVV